jgi:hypothetical protein
LSLFRSYTVSLLSQKIEQNSGILTVDIKGGAAQQQVIYILEKFAWGELESEEILGQSLTEEMGAITEALGQDGPGEL